MQGYTIVDIAKMAGVSVSTVSRVLNRHPDVSEPTRQKVLQVMQENSFVPNDSARSLKRENQRAIVVVVKGFENPFFTSMIKKIQNQLEENRYSMMLQQVGTDEDEVLAAIRLCKEKKPRGMIFMGGNFEHGRDKLAMLDVPYVMLTITVHKNVDRASFSSLCIDDYREAYKITEHICQSGHSNIAFMAARQTDKSVSNLRLRGFRDAAAANGIEIGAGNVVYTGEFSRRAGYSAVQHLLQVNRPTCLFCVSDILALGAMRALHDAGLAIPADISVIGFDGLDEGRYSIPSLASVQQPAVEMAEESVQMLLQQLRMRHAKHEHRIYPARFLQGESFAANRL